PGSSAGSSFIATAPLESRHGGAMCGPPMEPRGRSNLETFLGLVARSVARSHDASCSGGPTSSARPAVTRGSGQVERGQRPADTLAGERSRSPNIIACVIAERRGTRKGGGQVRPDDSWHQERETDEAERVKRKKR